MDCSPPGSSVHGDSPGKNTGVGCFSFSREHSQRRDQTCISCIVRQILYHWATWKAFSSKTWFLILWPERSIQSESQTLVTKFNSRWEKINKQRDFQDSSPAESPRMIHWKSAFYFSWWLWCAGKLKNYRSRSPREIYDAGKGSEEKSKGLRLSASITDTYCLVCFYSGGHLIKCFILKRVGKQHVFSFAQDSGSNVLLCDNLGAIS